MLNTGFQRIGECNRCGTCCMSLPSWDKLTDEKRALIRMFDPLAEEVFAGVKGGKCPNLRFVGKTSSCAIYSLRPRFCREFPNHPSNVIPECSIRLIPDLEVKA